MNVNLNEAFIGGTHLCRHGNMASICRECTAFRDGFAAARAMLREPSEEVAQAATNAYVKAPTNLRTAMRAALTAAADAMESNL